MVQCQAVRAAAGARALHVSQPSDACDALKGMAWDGCRQPTWTVPCIVAHPKQVLRGGACARRCRPIRSCWWAAKAGRACKVQTHFCSDCMHPVTYR